MQGRPIYFKDDCTKAAGGGWHDGTPAFEFHGGYPLRYSANLGRSIGTHIGQIAPQSRFYELLTGNHGGTSSLMAGNGTFRLAQGLRRNAGHKRVPSVKSLGLTISRLTQRKTHIGGVRRDDLSPPRPQSVSKLDRPPASSITRDVFQARLICPSQAIRGTRQTTYKNHSISTTQSRDGLWVAAFGRINGEMMEVENIKHAVLETLPHEAETIAIAEAQFQIDEQTAAAL